MTNVDTKWRAGVELAEKINREFRAGRASGRSATARDPTSGQSVTLRAVAP